MEQRTYKSVFDAEGRDAYHNGRARRAIYNGRNVQKKMIFLAEQGPVNKDDTVKIDTSTYKVTLMMPSPSNELITAGVVLVM